MGLKPLTVGPFDGFVDAEIHGVLLFTNPPKKGGLNNLKKGEGFGKMEFLVLGTVY